MSQPPVSAQPKPTPRFSTTIPGAGQNILVIAGTAARMMRRLSVPAEGITAFYGRISDAKSYREACAIVEEYFTLK
jgi:hypothetical protein